MHSFQDYLAHGQGWFFLPAAVLFGALQGLQPGHSKTMMASFIISIRGTVAQAALLGHSAAFAHRLPYASVGLIGVVGVVLAALGLKHISH